MDYIEIVDKTDRVIGWGKESFVHTIKALHRAIHVFLFDLKGRIYLTTTSSNKWQSSVSGHIKAGETSEQTAIYLLKEILGIEAASPKKILKTDVCLNTTFEYITLYETKTAFTPFPSPSKITKAEFFDLTEVEKMIKENKNNFTPCFVSLFTLFRRECK